ncbi:MAG: hypothetical protein LBO09_06235 [Candidatus Peribacteria bacterium]|jgi:hypothetical protein|nr:hypothetical protein [Candidatus Peribacteria bacterium]
MNILIWLLACGIFLNKEYLSQNIQQEVVDENIITVPDQILFNKKNINMLFHIIQKKIENIYTRNTLQHSPQIQQYKDGIISLSKKNSPLTLISNVSEIL